MSSEFDIVFAGGGSTACVVAGRLAGANPSLRILIVEQGEHSSNIPQHEQPCLYPYNFAPGSSTMSFHVGRPNPHLNGRQPVVPTGRCVGGGSAVNIMAYTRSSRSDYDDWAALGNEGWDVESLLPLIRKMETYTPQEGLANHGYSGPVVITHRNNLGVGRQFLEAARKYDHDRPVVEDNNDLETGNAYSHWRHYIDKTGKRCDAASRYVYPHSKNPNLQVLVGKRVKRVLIENGRAVGIEYTSYGTDGEVFTVKASKLIVTSAGAFGSPTILERSGIGKRSLLEGLNVPVHVDLPGVGDNYNDHHGTFVPFHSANLDTLDDVWHNSSNTSKYLDEWKNHGTGKIAHNGFEANLKIRPTSAEVAAMGASFQARWKSFYEDKPDKPLGMIAPVAGFPAGRNDLPVSNQSYLGYTYYDLYAESTGSIHMTSGDNANAPVDFDSRFFAEDNDLKILTYLYKRTRELARRMSSFRGEVASIHPRFPPGSPAACRVTDGPVPCDAPDIVYTPEDDLAIEEFHRTIIQAMWHSMGTCAMKPREQGGVVDSHLNVYGVESLKVADLSICPKNVGNNTYFTALLIGEKAATLIAEDLGISISGQ